MSKKYWLLRHVSPVHTPGSLKIGFRNEPIELAESSNPNLLSVFYTTLCASRAEARKVRRAMVIAQCERWLEENYGETAIWAIGPSDETDDGKEVRPRQIFRPYGFELYDPYPGSGERYLYIHRI